MHEGSPKDAMTKQDSQWKRITKELKQRVLVTNNINARDAHGGMSHVWIGTIIKSSEPKIYGRFTTFTDDHMQIHDITHYCEIPIGESQ